MTAEKILVVDDAPANIHVLAATLESAGYEVLAANNGVDACRIALKARPSLILLDIVMPDPDGLETCRRLKSDSITANIPILFLTARDANSTAWARSRFPRIATGDRRRNGRCSISLSATIECQRPSTTLTASSRRPAPW